jgi:hypothetical protein
MQYIGSLYASEVSSTELHAAVMSQLDIPNLPPNGFTVQMLLLTAIAVHCDGELENGRAILDRAIYLALDLRMQSRAFATMERDPVLAESWRRTFWGLYISDAYFATTRRAPMFALHSIEADVEIPCEECDYDGVSFLGPNPNPLTHTSQMIPRPKTLEEYESRDFEDETPVFSSFAYLIDLVSSSERRCHARELEAALTEREAERYRQERRDRRNSLPSSQLPANPAHSHPPSSFSPLSFANGEDLPLRPASTRPRHCKPGERQDLLAAHQEDARSGRGSRESVRSSLLNHQPHAPRNLRHRSLNPRQPVGLCLLPHRLGMVPQSRSYPARSRVLEDIQ